MKLYKCGWHFAIAYLKPLTPKGQVATGVRVMVSGRQIVRDSLPHLAMNHLCHYPQ